MNLSKQLATAGSIVLILVVLAIGTTRAAATQDGLLRVHFLDVGQGDAIFIQGPNGNQILIDGGPDDVILSELGRVMPFYDRSIDMVIATHPHADHIRGLSSVVDRYDVTTIMDSGAIYDSGEYKKWKAVIAQEGATYLRAYGGQHIDLGLGVTLSILAPLHHAPDTVTKDPHDYMVVAVLTYKNMKVLLTGDMEANMEKEMIALGMDLDADVLKVAHHGSSTSSSVQFLEAASPQVAIMQVGNRNRYNHPTSGTLIRLENSRAKQYRTDTNGTVTLTSDGDTFSITTETRNE